MASDDFAVRVSGIGKKYLVPQKHVEDYSRAPSLGERMKEFFPSILGASEQDYFWAVRDVSFEVKRGEVLGIVGENGSGKSTLLKVLAGVTTPSEGTAELRGRVGSLLEVGTGFHPDLSGRENIFFNGALLGLAVRDVRSKLDEIIEFSGIGDFIDVPVKRYSSGMYVRLAYSVAALLESDILILDEVLAVGDHAFREKTQEHVQKMTQQGRAVLFVSHSAQSVSDVCDRAIILYKGRVAYSGPTKEVLAEYQSRDYLAAPIPTAELANAGATASGAGTTTVAPRRRHYQPSAYADISRAGRLRQVGVPEPTHILKWISIHDLDGNQCAEFSTYDGMKVRIGFEGITNPEKTYFSVLINNSNGERMVTAHSTHTGDHLGVGDAGVVECTVPSLLLGDGIYSVMIDFGRYDFETNKQSTEECVPYATYIAVKVAGRLKGTGLNEFKGSSHTSTWKVT